MSVKYKPICDCWRESPGGSTSSDPKMFISKIPLSEGKWETYAHCQVIYKCWNDIDSPFCPECGEKTEAIGKPTAPKR